MELGKLGVWSWIDNLNGAEATAFAQELEAWGYREDVRVAAMLDASGSVPVFDGVAYRIASALGL